MSRVDLSGITRRYVRGAAPAIDGVDLTVDDHEFLVVLGPSGCGKTTLLRCVAGLEVPDDGRISIGDAVVFDSVRALVVPPHKRDIGMVFQSYSLWPHMSIAKNVAYPLASRRIRRDVQTTKTRRALELVECAELADRLPSALSGGQ
ncbi:MAG: ATP-binding cassette domain-containing protein, partial [Nocardioidaceae bacterium]